MNLLSVTTELAGDPIVAKLTRAAFNNAAIGRPEVLTKSGWFATRPSRTGNVYQIYARPTAENIDSGAARNRCRLLWLRHSARRGCER